MFWRRLVESERHHTELEVKQVLVEFHDDVATLRLEIVAEKLMERREGNCRRCGGQ